jgi:anaerobic selenocysteine-containing dehydrogenase
MNTARRNFLLLGSGAAAGAIFTPAPWKLLDDVSIWTQNWSWIPRPLRGEIKSRYTVCTLCPAACGVRARCVGDQPVSVAGVASHPVSDGRLCAIGLGAHQLAYHPLRVRTKADVAQVQAKLGEKRRTVLLDLYPGRAASSVYSRLDLTYAVMERKETSTVRRIAAFTSEPEAGLQIEGTRTIVSFGAPVLERWGRVLAAWSGSAQKPRVIQVEPVLSRTAALADAWVRVNPGTEGVLARALLHVTDADTAARECGISRESIESLNLELNETAIVVSGGECSPEDEEAIAALNVRSAGIVRRAASPVPTPKAAAFESLPDGTIELLLIDHGPVAASPGWAAIAPKLAKDAFVVSFSPYATEDVKRANLVLGTPAWLEAMEDAMHPGDAAVPFYTMAPPLLARPEGVVDPVDVLAGDGAREKEMRARVDALHKGGKGEVFAFADASKTPVKDFESAENLWEKFQEGACWTGEPPAPLKFATAPEIRPASMARKGGAPPPALLPGAGVLPSLTCKLTQESRLFTRSA